MIAKTLAEALAAKSMTERELVQSIVTPAEMDVWALVAGGLRTKEVAAKRNRSVKTVEAQVSSLYAKLGINCIADLTRAAVRYGVIVVEVAA